MGYPQMGARGPGQFGPPAGSGPPRSRNTNIDFGQMASSMSSSMGDGQPERVRRHPLWLFVAFVLFVAGAILIPYGIVSIVRETTQLRSKAVANGHVAFPDETPTPVQFVASKKQTYSIYVDVNSDSKHFGSDVANDTICVVQLADESTRTILGSSQSSEESLGHLSSVGEFTAPEGSVAVICQETSNQRPFDTLPFIVTPGTTNLLVHILMIVCGAFLLAGGIFAAVMGLRKRKVKPVPRFTVT